MLIKNSLPAIGLAWLIPLCAVGQKTEPLLFEHNARIISARYDDADNILITGSADGILNMWDPETGLLIRSFGETIKPSKGVQADISPDGKAVVVTNGRAGKIWNTKFGYLTCSLFGYSDSIRTIHFSSNSKWLVTASLDGSAKLWNAQTGKRHHSLNHLFASLGKKGPTSGVTDAVFCDGDAWVITGSNRPLPKGQSSSMDTLETGETHVPALYDSNALVWDMKTGKVVQTLVGYPFDVSPDGSRVITGSANTALMNARVWDIISGKIIFTLAGHKSQVTSVRFSKNKKWILTSSDDGVCKLWDAVSGKAICYLAVLEGNNSEVGFSPDNKWITTFGNGTANIFNVSNGQLFRSFQVNRPLVFSNDGKHVVVLSGKTAAVYEVESGKPVLVEKRKSTKALKVR